MGSRASRQVVATVGFASLVALSACSGSSSDTTPDSSPRVSTTVPLIISDQVLRLGLLIPQSGSGAEIGEPLVQVVTAAIESINSSGGVLGRDIELQVRDEGSDSATALAAVDDFITEDGIDALIGPFSSSIALSILPRLIENQIGVCSPTATSIALASFPDNGLFVRTTASDILASEAMAQVIEQTGVIQTSIAYPDDPFGHSFVTEIRRSLAVQGVSIVDEVAFDPAATDYSDFAEQLTADPNGVITLIGDGESGGRFLNSLIDTRSQNRVIVNDAISQVDLNGSVNLDSEIRRLILGVAVDAYAGSPTATTNTTSTAPPFAAATTDCVNLLALAAITTASDRAVDFMAQVPVVGRGGSECVVFDECLALLNQSLNIDYNGATGLLDLDPNGDPSRANFVIFGFDEFGHGTFTDRVNVVASP